MGIGDKQIRLYSEVARGISKEISILAFFAFALLVAYSNIAWSDETKDTTICENPKPSKFSSVTRLSYRYSVNGGENAVTQGAFILLPQYFNLAELMELSTGIGKSSATDFKNFEFGIKLARYLAPYESWGKSLSWVIRYQSATGLSDITSVGLQWNISETRWIVPEPGSAHWKSFLQVFRKDNGPLGTIDVFNWYQFAILEGNSLYIRGTNEYFFLPDNREYISVMQDIIMPLNEKMELFARHSYQNIDGFVNHSAGSRISLGIRVGL
jgi:hypothetical protein